VAAAMLSAPEALAEGKKTSCTIINENIILN
jgi:hypothetical protein